VARVGLILANSLGDVQLPWHQPETYTPKLVAKLFATVEGELNLLGCAVAPVQELISIEFGSGCGDPHERRGRLV